jgi:uncharacterized protein YecT (DUF1311 family)
MNIWKTVRTAIALGLIALSALSADASSSPSGPTAASSDCTDSKMGEYAECALARLAVLEAELKVVYLAAVQKTTSPTASKPTQAPTTATSESLEVTKQRLERSQAAWSSFREADCLLRGAEMLGSSGHDLLIYQCRLEHTDQRIKHLRSLSI